MSGTPLSAVLEENIESLGLNDFPCGFGSWRETESIDSLLDILDWPGSPWWYDDDDDDDDDDDSWSPQAKPLRRLAVTEPELLNTTFIYSFFTQLHILDKKVSVIDEGLLKFKKLEELVLSSNEITEIPAETLPSTLKFLELRANRVSSLNSLTKRPLPQLRYLGLGSNILGSHQDISRLTGRQWPQLVRLDLSDCEFQDQRALLNALSTLPSLKMLALKGNPFTLSPSYPGFAVDSLPELACLDTLWLLPEKRSKFRGFAMRGVIVDQASVTVTLSKLRGIPDALMSKDTKTLRSPLICYRYFITYQFLSSPMPDEKLNSDSQANTESTTHEREDDSDNTEQANKNCEGKRSSPDNGEFMLHDETYARLHFSRHSTSKLMQSELMNFSDAQTYTVSSLGDLKKFLNQGLYLRLEEEKTLDKSESTKNKTSKSKAELVQDAPSRVILGYAHVPLQSLVQGGQQVKVLCNFDLLQKDLGMEVTEIKKEDKVSKERGGSSAEKNMTPSKADTGNETMKQDNVQTDQSAPVQLEPATVELCVELKRWQSASEALTQQNKKTKK